MHAKTVCDSLVQDETPIHVLTLSKEIGVKADDDDVQLGKLNAFTRNHGKKSERLVFCFRMPHLHVGDSFFKYVERHQQFLRKWNWGLNNSKGKRIEP